MWAGFSGTDRFGDRLLLSLPFLNPESHVNIKLKTSSTQTEYSCRVIETLQTRGTLIERVEWGRSGDYTTSIRARSKISNLSNDAESAVRALTHFVTQEYQNSTTAKEQAIERDLPIEKVATELAENAIRSQWISILLDPSGAKGGISSLFVASGWEISAAFLADAPWKLSHSRLELSMISMGPSAMAHWSSRVAGARRATK